MAGKRHGNGKPDGKIFSRAREIFPAAGNFDFVRAERAGVTYCLGVTFCVDFNSDIHFSVKI